MVHGAHCLYGRGVTPSIGRTTRKRTGKPSTNVTALGPKFDPPDRDPVQRVFGQPELSVTGGFIRMSVESNFPFINRNSLALEGSFPRSSVTVSGLCFPSTGGHAQLEGASVLRNQVAER